MVVPMQLGSPGYYFGPQQLGSPTPAQLGSPSVYATQTSGITDMLNAIMPILMLVMLMAMVMPMMKGVTAGAR